MGRIVDVPVPKFPECWKTCGSCGHGDLSVDDVLLFPGDRVARDETLIVAETDAQLAGTVAQRTIF